MKGLIAALLLASIGLTLAPAQQSDGFLCTPYRDGNPAAATIYCAYLDNASLKWEIRGSVGSQGESKTFYDGTNTLIPPDLHIPYYKWYKFCAWNGTHRSEWTSPPVYYDEEVYDRYDLDMTIYCPMAPDPNEEE